jgi:hypothetical protein
MSAGNSGDQPQNQQGCDDPACAPANSPFIGPATAIHRAPGAAHGKRAATQQNYYDHEFMAAKLRQGWAAFCAGVVRCWGRTSANGVIAFLTLAMIVTSYWQWDAMREQTCEMIAQRQVELAEGQLRVAEAQVEQMRLEQRPWLSTSGVTAKDFQPGEDITFFISIHNSGLTPGTIHHYAFRAMPLIPGTEYRRVVTTTIQAILTPGSIVVAPGAVRNMPVTYKEAVDEVGIDAINTGAVQPFFAVVFFYSDTSGQGQRYNRKLWTR